MDKLLLRTKSAVDDCEKHLSATECLGSEIESYLTQYLLVVLCADIQQEIYKLTEARAALAADVVIQSYVGTTTRRVLRSVKKEDLSKFVALFGAGKKEQLNAALDDEDVTIFNNAVSNRHDVAHCAGSQITLLELKKALSISEKILAAIKNAIV
jgi:hypothetical protein